MTNLLKSGLLGPALLVAAAVPLMAGCSFQARGALAPPTIVATAHVPAPPTVTVTATAPTPPEPVVIAANETVEEVAVNVAPPEPPAEAVATPAPRAGYIWIAGHFSWSGGVWVWHAGRFVTARAGHDYIAPRYDRARRIWIRGHFRPVTTTPARVRVRTPRAPRIVVPRPPRVSARVTVTASSN